MTIIMVKLEKSKSRRGLHAVRDLAFIITPDGKVVEPKPRQRMPAQKTYSKGEAYLAAIEVPEGHLLVHLHMVKNLRGHVKGVITVYDSEGREVYRAVYRRLKLRYSRGDPAYAWAVLKVVEHLRIPFKRQNLYPKKRSR